MVTPSQSPSGVGVSDEWLSSPTVADLLQPSFPIPIRARSSPACSLLPAAQLRCPCGVYSTAVPSCLLGATSAAAAHRHARRAATAPLVFPQRALWRSRRLPLARSRPRSDARLPLGTATGGVRSGLGSPPSSRHARLDGTRCAAAVTAAHLLHDAVAALRRHALALPSAPRIRVAHPRRVPHSRVGGCPGYPGNPGNGLRPLYLGSLVTSFIKITIPLDPRPQRTRVALCSLPYFSERATRIALAPVARGAPG